LENEIRTKTKDFGALSPNLFFRFLPVRKIPEIILNEYSRNTDNALFEWLGKQTTRYFTKSKYPWFLWF
jgi:hypothetical protein